MLKDRHTIPVIVNCHPKNKSSFKTCVGSMTSLASCSERCFCRANFAIKTKVTTDVAHREMLKVLLKIHLETESDGKCMGMVKKAFH